MLYGTRYASLPVLEVGTIEFLRSVSIGKLQYSTECGLLAVHAIAGVGRYDLIGPPAWSNLCREDVLCASACVEGLGDVIRERTTSLANIGKTGLKELIAYYLTIEVDFVNAQACGHPLC